MFNKKQIVISIALAQGTFMGEKNEVTLPAVPTRITIDKTGGNELPKMAAEIDNLSLDLMQRLTVLAFRNLQTYNNVIKVEAGEEGQTPDLVFQGEIVSAVPVFNADGTATFKIDAASGYYPLQKSTQPVSVNTDTTIVSLFKQFADEAGYTLENNGVEGSVKNSVFTGTPIQKARQLARQTGVDLLIDNGTMVILPSYLDSREGAVPLLSADSGLLGYPAFTNDGISCKCLFSPLLKIGGMVKIESIVPKATGVWRVTKLHHSLQAYQTAGGDWSTQIDAAWLADE